MTDLSKLMQNAALLDVIDKSADEASILSAQNSYQAMRIDELKGGSEKLRGLWDAEFRRAEKAEAENAALREYKARIERANLNAQHGWERECADTDQLIRSIGLDPLHFRTESGHLLANKAKEAIDAARRGE